MAIIIIIIIRGCLLSRILDDAFKSIAVEVMGVLRIILSEDAARKMINNRAGTGDDAKMRVLSVSNDDEDKRHDLVMITDEGTVVTHVASTSTAIDTGNILIHLKTLLA